MAAMARVHGRGLAANALIVEVEPVGMAKKSGLKTTLKPAAENKSATVSRTISPAPKKGKIDSKTIKRAVERVISSRTGKKSA